MINRKIKDNIKLKDTFELMYIFYYFYKVIKKYILIQFLLIKDTIFRPLNSLPLTH